MAVKSCISAVKKSSVRSLPIDRGNSKSYNLYELKLKEPAMNEPLISAYKWLICLGETAAVFLFFKSKFKCEKPRLYFAVAIMPIVASLVFVVGRLHIPSALIAVIDTVIFVLYAFVCFDASPTIL